MTATLSPFLHMPARRAWGQRKCKVTAR